MFSQNSLLAGGAGSGPTVTDIDLTVRSKLEDTNNSSTYTMTDTAIGTADANRWVAIGWAKRGSSASDVFSSITLGGSSPDYSYDEGTRTGCGVALFKVTTGTTATAVLTTSVGCEGAVMQVFTFLSEADPPVEETQTSSTLTLDIDVVDGGGVVASHCGVNGSGGTISWTGLTARAFVDMQTDDYGGVAGDGLPAETGRTISVTGNTAADELVAVSLKPN